MNIKLTLSRVLLILVMLSAASALQTTPIEAETVTVRITVWDDTDKKPLPEKAEIWIRGLGSWWIARENVAEVPEREVGATDTMFIYPDARQGKELSIKFKMTKEMCPQGCPRDMIQVAISDNEVTVEGAPVKAANEEFTVTLRRR